ncbi:bifunctional UDP-N-acetylglucosamine diphosphorylase/glucosamine-1-phosphate N-acetyltransferase GlmU [Limoniibacter endophyticus]|uniref:Bifunctional protein GlmU n=1 Tax=Limoniibacter endophyticus TaxID=1565040 RepID=A0A8J3GEQ1_9HYPH|nr:bifunctional UDP-N-acetylglucosamine diphosphorylase/glucosamine-1-phosphate N-acetyltransferase GlmU [Limoniibacter endophyticus]GHC61799.1 bifunctional protein GlmU [Limoniibacter endophyticus]
MSQRSCLSVILAAGEGTRMKSALPKVLHPVAGRAMVQHVIAAAKEAGIEDVALVIGHGADQVEKVLGAGNHTIHLQEKRLGTANATLAARDAIARGYDDILVLFGDTPLVDPSDLMAARKALSEGASIVVLGFEPENPTGYGRLLVRDGVLEAIREHKDCSPDELKISLCNSGMMAIRGDVALELLEAVENNNVKGEYYLTDLVEIARSKGLNTAVSLASVESALGVNSKIELAEVENIWQRKRRRTLMAAGVSMHAPETVFLSFDTEIGADTTLEPNVFFGPGVRVEDGVIIRAFSHIEGATIARGSEIGPFARLRPGAELAEKVKVGNFCEVKKAVVEKGAKINHLSYIGDAHIGAGSNIGAGTITCNYDGFNKHKTIIGESAFVGSNTSLVAPITLGNGAYVASGSVLTQDVPAGALAFGRARQEIKPERGSFLREKLSKAAAAKKKT